MYVPSIEEGGGDGGRYCAAIELAGGEICGSCGWECHCRCDAVGYCVDLRLRVESLIV